MASDDTFTRARWRYTVHVGKQVAAAEGRLYGADAALYAHASTTCLLIEVPAEK